MGNGLIQISAFDKLLSVSDYEKAYESGYLKYESYINTGKLSKIKDTMLAGSNWSLTNLVKLDMPNVITIDGPLFSYYGCRVLNISAPKLENLNGSTFLECHNLSVLNLPKVTQIGGQAFIYCTSLKEIYLDSLSIINNSLFNGLQQLEYLSIPACTTISGNVFYGCTNLRNIQINRVSCMLDVDFTATQISELYLQGFSYIDNSNFRILASSDITLFLNNVKFISETVSLPGIVYMNKCSYIYNSVYIRQPKEIYLPYCTHIGSDCFYGDGVLQYVSIPNVSIINENMFASCSNLSSVNIDNCIEIKSGAFYECYKIQELNMPHCESFTFKSNIIGRIYYSYESYYSDPYYSGYGTYIFNRLSELYIDSPELAVILSQPFRNTVKKIIFNGKKVIFNNLEGCVSGIEEFICPKCETIDIIRNGSAYRPFNVVSIANTCRWSFPKLKNINYGNLLYAGNTFITNEVPDWISNSDHAYELIPSDYLNNFVIDFPLLEKANLYINGNRFMDSSYYSIYSMTLNIPKLSKGFLGLNGYITSPSINSIFNMPSIIDCLFLNDCSIYELHIKSVNGFIGYGRQNTVYNLKIEMSELISYVSKDDYYNPTYSYWSSYFVGFNFISLQIQHGFELPNCKVLYNSMFGARIGLYNSASTYFSAPELESFYIEVGHVWFSFETIFLPKLSYISNLISLSNSNIDVIFWTTNLTIGLSTMPSGFSTYSNLEFVGLTNLSASNWLSFMDYRQLYRTRLTLENVYLPKCEYICEYAFASTTYRTRYLNHKLSILDLPKCSYIGDYALRDLASLQRLQVPELLYLGTYTLNSCSYLTYLDLPKCSIIGDYGLPSTIELVRFGYSGIVSLGSVNMNSSHTHIIQVPESLYSAYMSDSRYISLMSQGNWLITAY